jgi:hypothetical protein
MTTTEDARVLENPSKLVAKVSLESKGECQYAVRGHNFSSVPICTNPYSKGCPDRIPVGSRDYCRRGSSEGRVA